MSMFIRVFWIFTLSFAFPFGIGNTVSLNVENSPPTDPYTRLSPIDVSSASGLKMSSGKPQTTVYDPGISNASDAGSNTETLKTPENVTKNLNWNNLTNLSFNEINEAGLDKSNVNSIPEPLSLGLLGLGLIGMAFRWR